jgi:hypothetical protein
MPAAPDIVYFRNSSLLERMPRRIGAWQAEGLRYAAVETGVSGKGCINLGRCVGISYNRHTLDKTNDLKVKKVR